MNLFHFAAMNARREFGMLGHYDRWKLEDGDDPGHGGGKSRPSLCHCVECDWRGNFSDAVAHFRLTDHAIRYKGTIQDFEKFRVTREELVDRR